MREKILKLLEGTVPAKSIQFTQVSPLSLPKYDASINGFSFEKPGVERPGLVTLPRSSFEEFKANLPDGCAKAVVAPPVFHPSATWRIAPTDAEALLGRLDDRQVYWATDLELDVVPGTELHHADPIFYMFQKQPPKRLPKGRFLGLKVKAMRLYEDARLERLLHRIEIEAPAASVMESGVNSARPSWERVWLNRPLNRALLALKHGGQEFDEKTWDTLMRSYVANDSNYYERLGEEYEDANRGWEWGKRWDRVTDFGFHPTYAPFVSFGYLFDPFGQVAPRTVASKINYTAEQKSLFKKWIAKLAESLHDRVLLTGYLSKVGGKRDKPLQIQFAGARSIFMSPKEPTGPYRIAVPPELSTYSGYQILLIGESGISKPAALIFEDLMARYIPRLTAEEDRKLFGDGSDKSSLPRLPIELEATLVKTEFLPPENGRHSYMLKMKRPEVIFHLQPTHLRILSHEFKQRPSDVIVYEQDYDAHAIPSEQLAAAPNPSVEKEPVRSVSDPVREMTREEIDQGDANGVIPFTAEAADLIMVKYMPEVLNEPTLERMMLARWRYEENVPYQNKELLPEDRFFVAGKPKPDAGQRKGLMEEFKKWIEKRAHSSPTKVKVLVHQVSIDNGKVILPSGLSGGNMSEVKSKIAFCERSSGSRPSPVPRRLNQPAWPGCEELKKAVETPSSYLILSAGAFGEVSGPRRQCGIAMDKINPDYYCKGLQEALNTELRGQAGMDFDDILVLDKTLHIPGSSTSHYGVTRSLLLDLDITSVRQSTEAWALHPWRLAADKVSIPGIRSDRRMQKTKTGVQYLFFARIEEALLKSSDGSLTNLQLGAAP
jgi:hypothetical protein